MTYVLMHSGSGLSFLGGGRGGLVNNQPMSIASLILGNVSRLHNLWDSSAPYILVLPPTYVLH